MLNPTRQVTKINPEIPTRRSQILKREAHSLLIHFLIACRLNCSVDSVHQFLFYSPFALQFLCYSFFAVFLIDTAYLEFSNYTFNGCFDPRHVPVTLFVIQMQPAVFQILTLPAVNFNFCGQNSETANSTITFYCSSLLQ